jgi:hypothetical protein
VCVKDGERERHGVFVSERERKKEREMVSLCVKEIEIMREREKERKSDMNIIRLQNLTLRLNKLERLSLARIIGLV